MFASIRQYMKDNIFLLTLIYLIQKNIEHQCMRCFCTWRRTAFT